MSPVLRVGLTGGIGSGKSTVCRLFTDLGVPVIDADEIAHYLTSPGQPALQLIQKSFGTGLCTDSGKLDRSRMRDLVFNDVAARTKLENILHPLIYAEIDRRVKLLDHPYCIICIPLLVEKHARDKVDRTLVIDAPEDQQIERAGNRDNTNRANIINIMRAQTTRANRLAVAEDIIHNDRGMDYLQKQVNKLHEYYNKIAVDYGNMAKPDN